VWCSVLQFDVCKCRTDELGRLCFDCALQCVAMCCSVVQRVAVFYFVNAGPMCFDYCALAIVFSYGKWFTYA